MDTAYPQLTRYLEASDADGYLVDADGEDSDQYYLSGYHAPDDFVTLYADGTVSLLVSELEYTRAKDDSDADVVYKLSDFDYADRVDRLGPDRGRAETVAEFLADSGVESVAVPPAFPIGTGDALREFGIDVVTDRDSVVETTRAVKTETEIDHVAETQRANEAAMDAAAEMLERATIDGDTLYLDGEQLTSERVRRRIELTLLEHGCGMDDCIVASGASSARAHDSGYGPLDANVPITVDIFPRNKRTRYHADMTRTFVKGEPTERIREWYALTEEAYRAALDAIAPGVTGEAVHGAACEVYEEAGYPTLRTDESTEDGFFHSTGHGVGLDVHEAPSLSLGGGELAAGHVVTVEPGLYEQGTGGVRIEDLVVVTEDGYRNLTSYPTDFQIV
ncbi:M24 family metallopeptidase [Halovivax cerinus]|uniref:M24 family metallopeptidase n=1 Tax=Halovivax cerinus TaxID=1487865 RepID=A0ABD5NTN2_9EURY|nr:Xaa-Pro peptidase family protein [Halovivax cerinus]